MAAITLIEETLPTRTTKQGSTTVTLSTGQVLNITAPAGTELLNAAVPRGKAWTVTVTVYVQETNSQ